MLTEFEKKVAGFIEANKLLDAADKILLAVSGGADSTALLYIMLALKNEGFLNSRLICAHINHQLRGPQAQADEDFIAEQTNDLNLEIITRRLDVCGFARKNKLSIETAGRKLRLESLLEIAKANNCNWIATGHQKNDNTETILQRMARGTGFRGLCGIRPVRVFADDISFVRPFLSVTRTEIVEYLKERNLKWREDETNKDCRYRRNFIRHRLIPQLQQDCTDSIEERLFDMSQSAQRFYNLLCSCAEKAWLESADCNGEKLVLDLKKFSTQHPAVKVELVRQGLVRLGSGERDLTQGHFERILELAEQDISNRKIDLPDGFEAWCEYGKLVFAHSHKNTVLDEQVGKSTEVQIPGQTKFGGYSVEATIFEAERSRFEKFKVEKSKSVEWFDLDNVNQPIVVRFREAGDRFWPLGLAGEKKVGKFLTAAKVPRQVRRKLLIVADNEKIIWLWPIRIAEHAKIISDTRKILELQITETEPI